MGSFETRYTYFLGQSPNFVLFRNLYFLIFIMNFHQIFIEIATAPTISNGFLWNYVHLLSRSVFTSSSFQFFLICIFFFLRIFIKFSLKSLLLLQFPMDSFATMYTYSLGQSSHLLCRFLKFVFFYFLAEFSSKFHSNRYCSYNI